MPTVKEPVMIMKLTDIDEEPPPPIPLPPPPEEPQDEIPPNAVEEIAENMVETEEVPEDQVIVEAGTLIQTAPRSTAAVVSGGTEEYLPANKVSVIPQFDQRALLQNLVYPSMALRQGVEGRVILDLFISKQGEIKQINILQEEPAGRGFGEAAVKAFQGLSCEPALSNGTAVACHFRYPVTFKLK
jgi:protein TonB